MQDYHTARDVFLTELLVEDELDCLVRPVRVCPPSELDQHTEGDVFVCDHQYHTGCSVRGIIHTLLVSKQACLNAVQDGRYNR